MACLTIADVALIGYLFELCRNKALSLAIPQSHKRRMVGPDRPSCVLPAEDPGMIKVKLANDDLAKMRFSCSPLVEIQASICALRNPDCRRAVHAP